MTEQEDLFTQYFDRLEIKDNKIDQLEEENESLTSQLRQRNDEISTLKEQLKQASLATLAPQPRAPPPYNPDIAIVSPDRLNPDIANQHLLDWIDQLNGICRDHESKILELTNNLRKKEEELKKKDEEFIPVVGRRFCH